MSQNKRTRSEEASTPPNSPPTGARNEQPTLPVEPVVQATTSPIEEPPKTIPPPPSLPAITWKELQNIAINNGCQSATAARLFLCAAFPTPSDRVLALLIFQVAMQVVKSEYRVRIQKRDLVPLVALVYSLKNIK